LGKKRPPKNLTGEKVIKWGTFKEKTVEAPTTKNNCGEGKNF